MVLLMDLYLNHDKLAEAREIYDQLKTDPEFVLDKFKVIKMTETIAKMDSIESKSCFFLFEIIQVEVCVENVLDK